MKGAGKKTGSGDSGGPLLIYNENTTRLESLGVVSGDVPKFYRFVNKQAVRWTSPDLTRFLWTASVADWVDEVISGQASTTLCCHGPSGQATPDGMSAGRGETPADVERMLSERGRTVAFVGVFGVPLLFFAILITAALTKWIDEDAPLLVRVFSFCRPRTKPSVKQPLLDCAA